MRRRILVFALAPVLLLISAAVAWLHINGRSHLRGGIQERSLQEFEPQYVGRYRHGDLVTGANTLPFLPEASLESDGRFTMTMVPSAWLAYSACGQFLHQCSGSWRAGDDGDGSLTLEFFITSVDGAKAEHSARARAMSDGFYFDAPGSYFLVAKDAAVMPRRPAE
jgi:hypothetical protein